MPQWQLETPPALKRGLGSPGAVRDRPGLHRRVDLLRARPGRPSARSGSRGSSSSPAACCSRLVVPSYVEGASLHQERGGATVIARYAFNELVELHRRLGDLPRLPDPRSRSCAFATTDYVGGVLAAASRAASRSSCSAPRSSLDVALAERSAAPARGATSAPRSLVLGDLVAAAARSSSLGLALLFDPDVLTAPGVDRRRRRRLEDLVFAFPLVLVAFSGIDASSGLAGQVAIGRARPASG